MAERSSRRARPSRGQRPHGRRTAIAAAALGLLAACGGGEPRAAPPAAGKAGSRSAPAGAFFVDRAVELGLDFVHYAGATGKYYMVEVMGAGGALLDYDNDGDLDLYLVQGAHLDPAGQPLFPPRPEMLPLRDRLFRNDLETTAGGQPRLRFTDVTATSGIVGDGYGMGVAAGDIDNDGWVDLYVTNLGSNRLYRNNGDDTFSDITAASGTDDPRWSTSAEFVDVDADGWLDLYVAHYVDFTLAGHKDCRALTGAPDYCGPQAYRPLSDRLFRNLGNGRFEDLSWSGGIARVTGAGLGVASADFDGDGTVEIYVANDGMRNFLWRRAADGRFVDVGMESGSALSGEGQAEAGMGVAVADYDGDGDEDLLITHLALETNTLYQNSGDGFFRDRSTASGLGSPSWSLTGFGAAWIDPDNDGWLDLLAVNGAVRVIPELAARGDRYPLAMPNLLFRNSGDGRFVDISASAGEPFALREVSRGVAVGDVDNDGDADVLLTNNNGPARLLLNETGAGNHWVGLRLVGREGRDALGARVGVRRPGRPTLWRWVRTGGSYLSAADPRLLVGLGDASRIEAVEVRWPDGDREELAASADRHQTLRQGSGRPLSSP